MMTRGVSFLSNITIPCGASKHSFIHTSSPLTGATAASSNNWLISLRQRCTASQPPQRLRLRLRLLHPNDTINYNHKFNHCNHGCALFQLRFRSTVASTGLRWMVVQGRSPNNSRSCGSSYKKQSAQLHHKSTTSSSGISNSNASISNNPSQQQQQQSTTSIPSISPSQKIKTLEHELQTLHLEINQLTYLIKQSLAQNSETQTLARKAEARASIIEHKLMDIQSHVIKIPALEHMANNVRQYLKGYSPTSLRETLSTIPNNLGNLETARGFLTNKYTAWLILFSLLLFWRYRVTMYQKTSQELSNVASLTLQHESLRNTIQETLTTVTHSPETLSSLSSLFSSLVSQERTEEQLIALLVNALKSESVVLAVKELVDGCLRDERLREQGGEFMKVGVASAVKDEGVQRDVGVGVMGALRSLLPWSRWWKGRDNGNSGGSDDNEEIGDGDGEIIESEEI